MARSTANGYNAVRHGRIGRLIINLLLRERQRLEAPLLYLCGFFESHRHECYESLQGIREEYRGRALLEHPRMAGLADLLVENPYVTVKAVEEKLEITNQGARNLIVKAASPEFGWLQEKGATGAGGRKIWVARDILDAMEAPSSYKP
ncbi:hypothetical protein [Corynebacterium canis]|uniref:hypothetical protein n=1 Tax=Corynebacterium canis TaxID=679663 RepID=UPI0025B364FC|nr:hypothetical protein [Corynebacterium canis]